MVAGSPPTAAGYRSDAELRPQWPDRVWAIEGCARDRPAHRDPAARLTVRQVVDVPPKLSARTRVFATGQGRKTDATDAHSVALVGTRMTGLRPVVNDEQLAVLRILVDRRRSLGEDHTRMVSQLHQLLLELIPGGAKKDLSAAQAKALLAKVRPRDAAGKTRRRVAAELISDLERIYARKKAANKELTELLAATGTSLTGPAPASAPPALPGCSSRSATSPGSRTSAHFASWNGTAPHRRLLRRPGPPPALPRREPSDQPGAAHHGHRPAPQPDRGPRLLRPQESRRQDIHGGDARVKRRLSDIVYQQMRHDARRTRGRAREGNGETTLTPARPAHIPTPALRTSHFPDPPPPSLNPFPPRLDTEGSHLTHCPRLETGAR